MRRPGRRRSLRSFMIVVLASMSAARIDELCPLHQSGADRPGHEQTVFRAATQMAEKGLDRNSIARESGDARVVRTTGCS